MSTEIVVAPVTPMELLQSAVLQGAGIDTIERLAKLQREMLEYDAKVHFNDAMQRAQSRMKPISADMNNPQTKSKYASYAQLDNKLRPIYSDEGFSLSFNTGESPYPDHVRVLCDVAHGGHIRPYQVDMPSDGKGAKGGDVMTKTHATGAAVSYGMRYLLKMIFNVAVGEADTDGNLPDNPGMPEQQFMDCLERIEGAASLEDLQQSFAKAYKLANAAKDQGALSSFIKAKDARKAELK